MSLLDLIMQDVSLVKACYQAYIQNPNHGLALHDHTVFSGVVAGFFVSITRIDVSYQSGHSGPDYHTIKDPLWPMIDIGSRRAKGIIYYNVLVSSVGSGFLSGFLFSSNGSYIETWFPGNNISSPMPQDVIDILQNPNVVAIPSPLTNKPITGFSMGCSVQSQPNPCTEEKPKELSYGATCVECGQDYPYAEHRPDFHCKACQLRATMFA